MKKTHRGYTLVELGAAMGVAGTMALIGAQETQVESTQLQARALGGEITHYNNAVSRYLAYYAAQPGNVKNQPSDPGLLASGDAITMDTGTQWLKMNCGGALPGSADKPFLDCGILPDNHTIYYRMEPTTTVSLTPEGALRAQTEWTPMVSGDNDSAALGLAALVSSAGYAYSDGSGTAPPPASAYTSPSVYCVNKPYGSSHLCNGNVGKIMSESVTSSDIEPWLRTDHGNTMQHVMEFGTSPSPQTDIDAVDDGSVNGTGMRQIINVARLYNIGSGSDSLILGKSQGNALYTNTFINTHSLLNNAIIIDGDAGIAGDLYTQGNGLIDGQLLVNQDILSNGNILADQDMRAKGHVIAESTTSDVIAGRDVLADRNLAAMNDLSVGNDASVTNDMSVGNDLRVGNLVHARAMLDYADPDVFSAGGYLVHMKGASRLNNLEINGSLVSNGRVKLTRQETEWASCTGSFTYGVGYSTSEEGSLSMSTDGNLVVCKDGKWQPVNGTPEGTYAYFNQSSCPAGWRPANGNGGTIDLRGEFIRGWDNGRGLDSGRSLGSLQAHSTKLPFPYRSAAWGFSTNGSPGGDGNRLPTSVPTSDDLVKSPNGSGPYGDPGVSFDWTNNETRPRNRALLTCMKL